MVSSSARSRWLRASLSPNAPFRAPRAMLPRTVEESGAASAGIARAIRAALAAAPVAHAFDPSVEAQNYSKGQERQAIYNTPEYRQLLAQISTQNEAASVAMQAADPERNFQGHLCARGDDGCAGDVRLYD